MRKEIVVALVLLAFSGCYCRRCQGQGVVEAIEPKPAETVVISSTEVTAWKETMKRGMNSLSRDPFAAMCDLLLTQAFGLPSIPEGDATVTITAANHNRMARVKRSVDAAMGFALINQAKVLEDNAVAVDAAIASATESIPDLKARTDFLRKAKLLRGE